MRAEDAKTTDAASEAKEAEVVAGSDSTADSGHFPQLDALAELDALVQLGPIDTGAMVCDSNGVCRPKDPDGDR